MVQILPGCGVEEVASTPAGDHLFDVVDLPLLSEDEQKWFHSYVAKMLYVSKRTKPECIVATVFLASRVNKCNTSDIKKLRRLLKYLRPTADRGIALEMSDDIIVWVYTDAPYRMHMDCGRSKSGMAVLIGLGTVIVSCREKHINTKSSTEAELVALLLFLC